jgi:hypothetical protein
MIEPRFDFLGIGEIAITVPVGVSGQLPGSQPDVDRIIAGSGLSHHEATLRVNPNAAGILESGEDDFNLHPRRRIGTTSSAADQGH